MQLSRAFERVVAEEKDRIFSYALYFLASPQEAEDVAQEVLIKLWHTWGTIEFDSVSAWLTRVTRNACYDALRKRRVRRFMHDDREEQAARVPTQDPSAAEELETTEIGALVRRHLAELPEPYRSVLILREIQEYRYDEISVALEIPINTVKAQIHRGRRLLRERLKDDAIQPPLRATGLS
jgi:RNA polymerase sigma-70 factor (ECF subfamily)